MINYEEELKKFRPSLDVNEAEDAIYNRDFTDVTDILKELINDEKSRKIRGIYELYILWNTAFRY